MTTTNYTGLFSQPFDASGLFNAELVTPSLAALPNGRTAVLWTDDEYSGVSLRLFSANGQPEGAPIAVTASSGRVGEASVAIMGDGNILVTYTSISSGPGISIDARVFSQNGNALGSSRELFRDFDHVSFSPSTVTLENGSTVTVFINLGLDGS